MLMRTGCVVRFGSLTIHAQICNNGKTMIIAQQAQLKSGVKKLSIKQTKQALQITNNIKKKHIIQKLNI